MIQRITLLHMILFLFFLTVYRVKPIERTKTMRNIFQKNDLRDHVLNGENTNSMLIAEIKQSESARMFTLINDCKITIWPGITPGANIDGGGFELKPGKSAFFTAPVGWVGRIWGRTGCQFNKNGTGSCQTGSCGGLLKCVSSGKSPATLAEFTLSTPDLYAVSVVDGFNLPLVVRPINGVGNCSVAGCDNDLRLTCPSELSMKVDGKTVGCRSACEHFGSDEYCCKGVYENPVICQPTYYSKKFKKACPAAYSYAYDDPTSIFTCSRTDYILTFCSSRSQPVCTYRQNNLICSGSRGAKQSFQKWTIGIVLYTLTFIRNLRYLEIEPQ